jgi:FdhD protein
MPRRPVKSTEVERVTRAGRERTRDLIAVEEPLQILLEHGPAYAREESPLAMTMRTPGHDRDLVTGFLYAEGVIASAADLVSVRHCKRSETPDNVVRVALRQDAMVPARLLERSLTVTSACGVCGERTVEALSSAGCRRVPPTHSPFEPDAIRAALASLEVSQLWFRHTGGTHAAALFDQTGRLLLHREDVGRHNALDKLFGACLADPVAPARRCFVVVSSRASFELVQKTVRAGIPLLVAIGAASSLAVETARRFNVALVGFARENRFNVYAGGERIALEAGAGSFVEVGAAE